MWKKRGNLPPEWVLKLEIAVRQAVSEMERNLAQARLDNIDRHKLKPDLYPADNAKTVRDDL